MLSTPNGCSEHHDTVYAYIGCTEQLYLVTCSTGWLWRSLYKYNMLQCMFWCLVSLSQILDGPFKTSLWELLNNGFLRLVKFCCRAFPHDLTLKHQIHSFGLQIETKLHTMATDEWLQKSVRLSLWFAVYTYSSSKLHQSWHLMHRSATEWACYTDFCTQTSIAHACMDLQDYLV